MTAIRDRHVTILAGELEGTSRASSGCTGAEGIRSMCFVPIVFRDEVLGLLVLYHRTDYHWSDDETDLARSFGDHIAVGDAATPAWPSRRGRSPSASGRSPSSRSGSTASTTSTASPRRSSARPAGSSTTTPSGSTGSTTPPASASRSRSRARSSAAATRPATRCGSAIGEGLTGWVAEHNETVRSGDAAPTRAAIVMVSNAEPESMLSSRWRSRTSSTAWSWSPSAGVTASTPTTR